MVTREGDVEVIRQGLTFTRYFTTEGVHPFDEVTWETRDAIIPNFKEGGNAFEQRDVEFPITWSQNATNIVAQKYFRGPLNTPQRESSVRQLVCRVVDTITGWGRKNGYFATDHDARSSPTSSRTCWCTRRRPSTRRSGSTSACPTRRSSAAPASSWRSTTT